MTAQRFYRNYGVEIVVPFVGDDPHRREALAWLEAHAPFPITVARPPVGEPYWSKGATLHPAVRASTADIVILHDADVWATDGLEPAVYACLPGSDHAWAMPHRVVKRLTAAGSAAYMRHRRTPAGLPLDQPAYDGMWGGGIVVARREILLDVPVDPRFVGWGQEDESHAAALYTMHGPGWRGTGDLIHLWHPPQQRLTRRIGSDANWALRNRYAHARAAPARMLELLTEVHACLSPTY